MKEMNQIMAHQRTPEQVRQHIQESSTIDDNGCWLWNKHIAPNGYGTMRYAGGTNTGAHRVSFMVFNGEIPDGMVVRHHPTLCNNKRCVNPEHLIVGTHQENIHDKILAGTMNQGESHYRSNLTESDVIMMREIYDKHIKGKGSASNKEHSVPKLAKMFGVSYQLADRVCRRLTWKHLP